MDWIDKTSNKKEVLDIITTKGEYLYYASEKLKNDEEVVSEAMDNCPMAFQYASERIRTIKSFALHAVMENGMLLEFVEGDTWEDIDVLKARYYPKSKGIYFTSSEIL